MSRLLYPFLWAIAPILALAAENSDRGTLPSDLRIPVVLASLVALVGLLIGRIVTREKDRQSLVALTTVALFSAYGPARALFPEGVAVGPPIRMSLILGMLLAVGVAVTLWIRSNRRPVSGATRFLFAFGLALVLLFGTRFVAATWRGAPPAGRPVPTVSDPGTGAAGAPDIWLIVFDGYTGQGVLQSQYGLDNSAFLDSLRALGFQVAEGSRANYVLTVLSLGAMLNWEYLHDPEGRVQDLRSAEERLEDNRTVLELKGMGYEFVFFRSSFPALRSNRHADVQWPDRLVGEFTTYWLGTTVLYPISYLLCELRGCVDMGSFLPESPNEMRERVAALVEVASKPGPKSNSLTPPVILLQGDHGYGRFEGDHPLRLEQARTEQVEDRIGVLGAYRLPGAPSVLWPGISPVTVFRVLFNVYFGRELDPLPDRTFWSDWDDPYGFVELPAGGVRGRTAP
jgi:hypothetical protein